MTSRNFCGRTRREFVWQAGAGFGAVALSSLLDQDRFFPAAQAAPAHGGKGGTAKTDSPVKHVIFLFMYGGPSHIDTFDYKPDMIGMDGKTADVKTFGRGGHK